LVVKTRKNAALAAAHRIDLDRWWDGFGALLDRIRPRFARYEPARHAEALMLGGVVRVGPQELLDDRRPPR